MRTKIGKSLRLALILAIGAVATMLALGTSISSRLDAEQFATEMSVKAPGPAAPAAVTWNPAT